MKVFVTGATGFVGSVTVQELLKAGHQVLGLARSGASAEKLAATGADVLLGSLEDLESLKKGAEGADAVIHTAFIHDFSKFAESCEADRLAIETMGSVLKGSNRPILVTGGLALLAEGRFATEDDRPPASFPRASDAAAQKLFEEGVQASVVRLPPSVHGEGDHGFVPMLIAIAREKGVSAYVEDGANRWPGVHRLDSARLYRLAIEKGEGGKRYHAIGDDGVPTKQIAEVIGKRLGLPVVSVSREEAGAHFGFLGFFFGADAPATATKTEEELGWKAVEPGLLADIDQPYYFN